ncbi:hypothetical protein A6R68_15067, partial [Neotoma lepida]
MMAEKCEELSICSEKEEDPAGKAMDLTLFKRRLTVTMMPVEEKEEEPNLKASATAKDEGLFLEGGVTTFTGEIASTEIPAGAPTVAAVAGNGGVPSGYPVNREKLNTEIKHQLMKEVRRYGR